MDIIWFCSSIRIKEGVWYVWDFLVLSERSSLHSSFCLLLKRIHQSLTEKPIHLFLIIGVLFLYCLNNVLLKRISSGALHYFLVCHLNDILCPVFFFSYSNMLLRMVGRELKTLRQILLFGALVGFGWEFIAPLVNPRSVSDYYDLLCYLLGSGIYYFTVKRTNQ